MRLSAEGKTPNNLFDIFLALIKVAEEEPLGIYGISKCKIFVESLQLKWKLIIL